MKKVNGKCWKEPRWGKTKMYDPSGYYKRKRMRSWKDWLTTKEWRGSDVSVGEYSVTLTHPSGAIAKLKLNAQW